MIFALIGVGGVLVPNQVVITVITPDDLIASVTALTVGLRAQSQVIGLALFYNRYTSELQANTLKHVGPIMAQLGVTDPLQVSGMMQILTAIPFRQYAAMVPGLSAEPVYSLLSKACIDAFGSTFKFVYLITIGFGVPACIAAGLLGDMSQYMDEHVAVPVM